MITIPVRSSNIAQIGYDPKEARLTVWFHSGSVYVYEDVPFETIDKMLAAESIGKFFHANIRSKFEARKLEEAEQQQEQTATTQQEPSKDQQNSDNSRN